MEGLRVIAAELLARREEGVDALDEAVVVEADLLLFAFFFMDDGSRRRLRKKEKEDSRATPPLELKKKKTFSRLHSLQPSRSLTWSTSLVPMACEMAVEIAVTPPLRSSPPWPAPRRTRSESKNCSSSKGCHCSRFRFAAVQGIEKEKKVLPVFLMGSGRRECELLPIENTISISMDAEQGPCSRAQCEEREDRRARGDGERAR